MKLAYFEVEVVEKEKEEAMPYVTCDEHLIISIFIYPVLPK